MSDERMRKEGKQDSQVITKELGGEGDLLTIGVHVEVHAMVVELAGQLKAGPALSTLLNNKKKVNQSMIKRNQE